MPELDGRGFNWNLDMNASPAIDNNNAAMINDCRSSLLALSSSINPSTICFCVEFTKENREEFVVSNLLDFGADNSPALLKDALVVPEPIQLLQCVGCVFI